jgi:hypothetical protein
MGEFSKSSKYCFATAVPRLTLANSKGGLSMKYAGALGSHFIRQATDTVAFTRMGPTNLVRLVKYLAQANSVL